MKETVKLVDEKFGETKDNELPYMLCLHRDFHGNEEAMKQTIRSGDMWQQTHKDPDL